MRNLIITCFLVIILFCCGCKDSTTSPGIDGTMIGYVVAHDTVGPSNNSGVKISLEGTNYSTLSDSSGRWEMTNIPPGTYTIAFTKDNYATEKTIAYKFAGNGTDFLYTQNIYAILWMKTTLVIRPFDNDVATFSSRIFRNDPLESLPGTVMLLFGKDSLLSPLNSNSYFYRIDNLYQSVPPDSTTGYSFSFSVKYELLTAGFKHGDKIFCEAFPSNLKVYLQDPVTSYQVLGPSYIDINTYKRIYTGFGNNHSEVKSFILP